jgi:hypothetical protein
VLCERHGVEKRPRPENGWLRCPACDKEHRQRYEARHPRRKAARYRRLIEAGLCGQCGQDVLISASMCFTCLGIQDEQNLNRVY